MFEGIKEKIEKTNAQRITMGLLLVNIMKNTTNGAGIELRAAVAASIIEMIGTTMIDEDIDLIRVLNDGIDSVCNDARENYGIDDFRDNLNGIIKDSRNKLERINTGDDILKSLNLDGINLN